MNDRLACAAKAAPLCGLSVCTRLMEVGVVVVALALARGTHQTPPGRPYGRVATLLVGYLPLRTGLGNMFYNRMVELSELRAYVRRVGLSEPKLRAKYCPLCVSMRDLIAAAEADCNMFGY